MQVRYQITFLCLFLLFGSCKNTPQAINVEQSTADEIPREFLNLEQEYESLLKPIIRLKSEDPKTYWFIVSWLKTNHNSPPNWTGYGSPDWRSKTKKVGLDCSGFARVMQDQIFNRQVRGGSQGILDNYCKRIEKEELIKGDMVFFKAYKSKNKRVTHSGIYLIEGYFVHVTSKKSAAKGLGLNISSLEEPIWKEDFVAAGRIIEK